jgi:hypothetical protein
MFGGVTNNFDIFNYDQEMVGREDDGLGNEFLPAYGITEQDILNYFNTPGLTPQEAVATMQQYGIQPEDIAPILGLTPEDARSQYTAALATAPTTAAPAAVTQPATTTPPAATTPPADSNIVMDAVREVGKVFDAGLKAFGDLIGGFDLSAVILNPVNPQATVVFGPPSGSPVTVIGNMPTSKAPIGVNTGIPALDAVIGAVFAGKNSNRPLGEVIQEAVYEAVSDATGVDVQDIIKGTETGLEGVVDQVEKVVTGLDTKTAEVEAVQRPAIIADWYDKNRELPDEEIARVMDENGVTPEEMAGAIGEDPAEVKRRYDESKILKETPPVDVDVTDDFDRPDTVADTIESESLIIGPNENPIGPVRPIIGPDQPAIGPVQPPLKEVSPDQVEIVTDANPPRQTPGFQGPSSEETEIIKQPPVVTQPVVVDPVDPLITDPFPEEKEDEEPTVITNPITEPPPVIKLPDDPFTTDPEVILHPDEVPPIIKTPDEPDYTSVIGGALGGLFGAITPTPITDSIFAPERVRFNRLPLDITNTLFGGFRR